MRRALRPLAALALIALIGAGCSDAASDTGDTGGASTAADGGSATTTVGNREKAMRFADCMRENGVSGFPDPDGSGELTIDGVVNGSSLDPGTPAWEQALAACRDLQPPGFTGDGRSAEQQAAALEFAQCMRDNGITDFPDPARDGPLIDTTAIGRGDVSAREIPGFEAAQERCHDLAARALGRR